MSNPNMSGQGAECPRDSGAAAGLGRSDRIFLRSLLAIFLVASSIQWLMIIMTPTLPPELRRGSDFHQYFSVDMNTGNWVDWMQLEGIGPSLGHRIVADRNHNGPFVSIDDRRRVPGIGPLTLDRIRHQLTISHANQKP